MILCCKTDCWPGCDDWIIFGLGLIVTLIITVLIYFLKPNVIIDNICFDSERRVIKATLINLGRFNAVNLKVEICAINRTTRQTRYLRLENVDFIILPSRNSEDNTRVFSTIEIDNQNLRDGLTNNDYSIRVRAHSSHSFTGLGKAIEKSNNNQNK